MFTIPNNMQNVLMVMKTRNAIYNFGNTWRMFRQINKCLKGLNLNSMKTSGISQPVKHY